MGGSTETRGAARQARRPGGRSPGRPPPAERHPPSAQQLRALIDQADYTTAAVLLEGFDLDTESDPQVLYCAGICLGSLDRPDDAVKLLRRARAGGFAAFWCAYHLGLFEMKAGRAAQACFYLTVSLILDPARDDLVPLLSRLAPDLDLSLLRVAQRGNRSAAAAQTAVDLGRGVLDTGNPAAAGSYFAVALILNPDNEAARALLLELAPDVTFEVMPPPAGRSADSRAVARPGQRRSA